MATNKVFFAAAGLAAIFIVSEVQAAPLSGLGTKVQTQPIVEQAAVLKKLKKKLFRKKKAKKSPPPVRYRTCGEYMFRDRKTGKCVDRRYVDLN